MFNHVKHQKVAEKINEAIDVVAGLRSDIQKEYGISSTLFKSAGVCSRRLDILRDRLNDQYMTERARFLLSIPDNLHDAFPEDIYLTDTEK